ncbi:hypothetical protein [Psychromonas aquimarina]|uniref:hypothetical protein n=1 Tax=Psychromonas aquimarina TaxID=444919 RepID=UPI00041AFD74|nr:hypothetical protein [Psychromonas aquimarina]
MLKIKSLSLVCAFLFSGSAFAGIQVTDKAQGAWVQVTDNNQPSVNAEVSITNLSMHSETYLTDDKGKVYIPITAPYARHIKYLAVTKDGTEFTKSAFHSRDK